MRNRKLQSHLATYSVQTSPLSNEDIVYNQNNNRVPTRTLELLSLCLERIQVHLPFLESFDMELNVLELVR